MRRLMLISMFAFFLGALQMVRPDAPVSARHVLWHCCTCSMCDSGCYCKYQSPYCYCTVPEEDNARPGHREDEITIDIRGKMELRSFIVAQKNIDAQLTALMSRQRSSSHYALRLLDGYEERLKIWCPNSEIASDQDNVNIIHVAEHEHQ